MDWLGEGAGERCEGCVCVRGGGGVRTGGGGGGNKGFSILRHLQGKGCKTGLCGQAWSFPLFDPM